MLLTDYFRSEPDLTWDIALQCGVRHGVIRLPEDDAFDVCDAAHWDTVYQRFANFGITPVVIEPLPNALHRHIKEGDALRDASIEKVIRMFPHMQRLGIQSLCFNFMAHIGWLRTRSDFPERGNATVTAFDEKDFPGTDASITAEALWKNYAYFIRAVVPAAEKYGVRLALHPDDPPLSLGSVARIFTSAESMRKAIFDICPSPSLGLTLCQANFFLMGENLERVTELFGQRIFFIHFRNTTGTPHAFRETFHDNGDIDMADVMAMYVRHGIDVPVRVDHVPTLSGESSHLPGYDALGRLFAIGYLKGILDAVDR